jgi:alcohol dehydrogenase (cytochrome c)
MGLIIWAKQIADPSQGYFTSMPPLIHGDLIYIGPAGAESAASGWVAAFRLSDGSEAWRFNIVPADGEPGADTWGPDPGARKHAGGTLWTAPAFDEEKGVLYVPGGNPAPDFYDKDRPGSNLYTDSVIALDPQTGHLRWYRQFIAHDGRDYDVTHVSPVIKAKSQTIIVTTGKDGIMRAVDGDTHKIVYSKPFTTQLKRPLRSRCTRSVSVEGSSEETSGMAPHTA